MLKVGKQIIDASRYTNPTAALWVYGAVFLLYFIHDRLPFSRLPPSTGKEALLINREMR
ncbi:MAG: hypothetical protein ACLUTA_16220 [Blautia wexlerae]